MSAEEARDATVGLVPVGADQVWLEDSGGDGPVVLLLHPGVGDSRVYDDIWPQLTAVARCLRFDYRAYGRSPDATEPWSAVGDALAVLDMRGVAAAHIVGNSMGGGAALDLAVLQPARVESLTLLGPGISGADWPDDPESDAAFEAARESGDPERMVEFAAGTWAASGHDDRVMALVRRATEAAVNAREFEVDPESTFDRLGEISVPTVMVVGEVDYAGLVATNHEAAARIPGCRVVVMPGVDHFPSVREPEWVLRLVLEQLRG